MTELNLFDSEDIYTNRSKTYHLDNNPNIILKWKPKSMTPNEQLDEIKKEKNIIGKSCFAGRLDPMASGWMIYLLNETTKLGDKYMGHNKTYEFNLVCGISTESMDCMGIIKEIKLDYDRNIIEQIITNINEGKYKKYQQIMPACSAYKARHKITGEKKALWEWSMLGEISNIDLPISEIELIDFKIINSKEINLGEYIQEILNDIKNVKRFDQIMIQKILEQWNEIKNEYNDNKINIIRCITTVNSGTFIRYLANMIGEDVKIPCHAQDITRTKIYF
jgi:tRNA U55 pseudouridine synthase TruB